jgi:3-methyladenine DNA glycosylase/8-oxoguanine DNA glycosylase
VVRQRSAKPSLAGSIPAVASILRISSPDGFSFLNTVESHGWYQLAPFRWDGRVLRRAEAVGNGVTDLEIRHRRGAVEISAPSAVDEGVLKPRIVRMLQLDVDVSDFHRIAASSAAHEWVVAESFGRLLCGTTLFEDIVKIIATTNTTWRQTVRMIELLVEKCGRRSPSGAHAFPYAHDIVRFDVDEL